MHYLVLLERFSPASECWSNLVAMNETGLSVEKVIRSYKGFEGQIVSVFNISNSSDNSKSMIDECIELKSTADCLLLHVISDPDEVEFMGKDQATLMGYEVGSCDEEVTIYSSIFNEILFGGYDELISYKNSLNQNFLFPDRTVAEAYVDLHNRMSAQGKNVEDYMEMIIYQIWEYSEQQPRSM